MNSRPPLRWCGGDGVGVAGSKTSFNDLTWQATRGGNHSLHPRVAFAAWKHDQLQPNCRQHQRHLHSAQRFGEHLPCARLRSRSLRDSRFTVENIRFVEGRLRLLDDLNCPHRTHISLIHRQAFSREESNQTSLEVNLVCWLSGLGFQVDKLIRKTFFNKDKLLWNSKLILNCLFFKCIKEHDSPPSRLRHVSCSVERHDCKPVLCQRF